MGERDGDHECFLTRLDFFFEALRERLRLDRVHPTSSRFF